MMNFAPLIVDLREEDGLIKNEIWVLYKVQKLRYWARNIMEILTVSG